MTDTADMATTETTIVETTTEPAENVDHAKEAEKWKALARKHEDKAKANANAARELEEVKRQSMTELEAAVDKARSDARAEVTVEFGVSLATEAVRGAAAGRVADVEAFMEGIDARKFVGEDGQPDRDAIASWLDRIAPNEEKPNVVTTLDLGQGVRGATATTSDPLEKALSDLANR